MWQLSIIISTFDIILPVRDLGLRTVLLPLLQRPRFGRELTEEMRRRSGGRMQAGPGSIYPALRKLEGEGLARSWTVSRGRGRPRRYYELTARGFDEVHRLQDAVRTAMAEAVPLPVVPTAAMKERVLRARDLSEAARRIRASMVDLSELLRLKLKAAGPKDFMDIAELLAVHPNVTAETHAAAEAYGVGDELKRWLIQRRPRPGAGGGKKKRKK